MKKLICNELQDASLKVSEAVAQRCSVKQVFLEISQNSQESTCARAPVNFAKFLRTPSLKEKLMWLLLKFTKKKHFHTSSFMYFAFKFSECIMIASSDEDLKVCEHNFFQRKVVLLVIYLLNHDSSKSTIFMLNMAFDVLLSAVFVK